MRSKCCIFWVMLIMITSFLLFGSEDIKKIDLPIPHGMQTARLYYLPPPHNCRAVLLLLPGINGDGKRYLYDYEWRNFANKNRLALVSVFFVSTLSDIKNKKGYYYPDKGSGDILLEGMKKINCDKLPLLMYGFSGGAHFVSRFVAWKPEKVKAWCAYSAAWWDMPTLTTPPGLVVCGENDFRLKATQNFFGMEEKIGKNGYGLH